MEGQWTPTTGTKNQYQYNGKELNEDLGLNWNDYGARWYDPAIAKMTTIDRFAEKYYNFSPYSYGAGNPIKYIDVNGDSLWISYNGNNILYSGGTLYNRDGSMYVGKGAKLKKDGSIKYKGFLGSATKALNEISTSATGASLIEEIQNSNFNVTISEGLNMYNPDDHGAPGTNNVY